MESFFPELVARLSGPGAFRFILQPVVAVLLGIRDGVADARAGRPPYVWGVVFRVQERREMLRQGAAAIVKPFAIAIILDAVLSYITLGTIHPGQTLLVATCLIGLPYILARAATNRLVTYTRHLQPTSGTTNATASSA